ncbi:MFS transporter [Sphaerisporangium sp. NPDC049003]|uniref:MFS transporter n=1 Tax=Sphaerisporangium sp. NPDC049003 TaxID=3364517 RepID=UPI0037217A6D
MPRLPGHAWLILSGDAVSAVGAGLTLPFLLVYLHDVRGIELGLAGLVLSTIAVAGLAGTPVGGLLADRFGARRPAAAGLVLAAAGTAGMIGVRSAWEAALSAAVYGFGVAVTEPAFQALLSTSVPPARRSQIFAVRHALLNVGLSAGSLLAAFLVDFSSPQTFVTIFVVDACTFLTFAVLIARAPGRGHTAPGYKARSSGTRGGYREILADRLLLRICVSVAVVFTCGYAQYYSAYPIFSIETGGLDAGTLQLTFLANTCTVVLAQLLVLRLVTGRRRTIAFAWSAGLMAIAWLIVVGAAQLGGGPAAVAAFMAAMVLFAVGETLMAPSVPVIVNDLASDDSRGRYNGVHSFAQTLGYIIGPAVAGAALGSGHGSLLFLGLALALGLVALQATRIDRLLTPAANLVGAGPADASDAHTERTHHGD